MDEIEKYIQSDLGQAIVTLIAYAIKRTPTKKDDEILQDADQIAAVVAEALANLADQQPTDKDAKRAAVEVLEAIAKETKTKIDDLAVGLFKKFIG